MRELAYFAGERNARCILSTSGATEANNTVLRGVLRGAQRRGPVHAIVQSTEHPSVLEVARALQATGVELSVVPVDGQGLVEPDTLRDALKPNTALISCMAVNHEIGAVQPIAEIGALARDHGVLLHSDFTQAALHYDLASALGHVDFATLSAHKIHGPVGVGLLVVTGAYARARLEPLLLGGGQQEGLRAGTVSVALVAAMAEAARLAVVHRAQEVSRLQALRERLFVSLRELWPALKLLGPSDWRRRHPGNLTVRLPGVDTSRLLAGLKDIALSSGSACAAGRGSAVVQALGKSAVEAREVLRFGLGRGNTATDIEHTLDALLRAKSVSCQ